MDGFGFDSMSFWKEEERRHNKRMLDLMKLGDGSSAAAQFGKLPELAVESVLKSIGSEVMTGAKDSVVEMLREMEREQSKSIRKMFEIDAESTLSKIAKECEYGGRDMLRDMGSALGNTVSRYTDGVSSYETLSAQVGKTLYNLEQDRIRTTIELMQEAFNTSDWLDTAVGKLSINEITPAPPMPVIVPISPAQRAQPQPKENANTYVEERIALIEMYKAQGLEVEILGIMPNGERVEVESLGSHNGEYIWFSTHEEPTQKNWVRFDEIKGYQFIVFPRKKKEKPEEPGYVQ